MKSQLETEPGSPRPGRLSERAGSVPALGAPGSKALRCCGQEVPREGEGRQPCLHPGRAKELRAERISPFTGTWEEGGTCLSTGTSLVTPKTSGTFVTFADLFSSPPPGGQRVLPPGMCSEPRPRRHRASSADGGDLRVTVGPRRWRAPPTRAHHPALPVAHLNSPQRREDPDVSPANKHIRFQSPQPWDRFILPTLPALKAILPSNERSLLPTHGTRAPAASSTMPSEGRGSGHVALGGLFPMGGSREGDATAAPEHPRTLGALPDTAGCPRHPAPPVAWWVACCL